MLQYIDMQNFFIKVGIKYLQILGIYQINSVTCCVCIAFKRKRIFICSQILSLMHNKLSDTDYERMTHSIPLMLQLT